ncbi:MAG: sigma-70 family RNA polymerase sigma factor [Acidobacteria bacterium]|nr:sigma-70 family RNA polymerase sigma factor [Acidobacteriota bacterium]
MGSDPEQSHISDAELIHAIVQGDEQAFASLYDRYHSSLLGFLLRILNTKAEAEDVLQEIFVQVWQHAPDYDETRGRVFTWLVTIARSRALDRLRSLDSRERTVIRASHEWPENISDGVNDAIESEQGEEVRHALEQIPEAQRHALLLAYFEGLSQSEIAARLGKPLGTIKTRTRDGLKKLRNLLSERLKGKL